ncbi:MAG: hypothetical protein M0P91_05490 [Sulfuricurvum sp.]|jgi:hypothetical protein|uniref:hypothetical protein n=1 Tax=Sulfuricurvum sp. TaxID=2025608 RepID=UPI002600D420|nr:hypothetical protein [Sulfuricurvum sp.]MCK9372630.1 hypothetical protein [Sulfuricurvum sp.]
MKRIITLYTENRNTIHFYLKNCLLNFSVSTVEGTNLQRFFETEKSAHTIYAVNRDFIQITPDYGRKYYDSDRIGKNKQLYFQAISFENDPIFITNPYLHHITGLPSLTVVKHETDHYIVIDFDMFKLLQELRLVEYNGLFEKINKTVMGFGGLLLGLVAAFLILYGGYMFGRMLFIPVGNDRILHQIFMSVISITIGMAIYDLAKTMIENEVLFKTLDSSNEIQSRILSKFLTSIIIALSIESLMAVFKIVLDDYSKLVNALYLILSVTLLIVGTGFYNYFSRPSRRSDSRSG